MRSATATAFFMLSPIAFKRRPATWRLSISTISEGFPLSSSMPDPQLPVSLVCEWDRQRRPSERSPRPHGQHRDELLRSVAPVVARVHELDRPVDQIEDRHVRGRAQAERPEPGHAPDDLRRLHPAFPPPLLHPHSPIYALPHPLPPR